MKIKLTLELHAGSREDAVAALGNIQSAIADPGSPHGNGVAFVYPDGAPTHAELLDPEPEMVRALCPEGARRVPFTWHLFE